MSITSSDPIKIFPDGNLWCALLGEDLQSGDAEFGKTPVEALLNFLEKPPCPIKEDERGLAI